MSAVQPNTIISHWSHRADSIQVSSDHFYSKIEQLIQKEQLEKVDIERVNFAQGGIFSAKREYLQVRRGQDIFHVCAAPFGSGFFVSSWLGNIEKGFWLWVAKLPFVGMFVHWFIKPLTYYKVDTALMFQSVTQGAVTAALDEMLKQRGLRELSDNERKPVMRDFFAQLG